MSLSRLFAQYFERFGKKINVYTGGASLLMDYPSMDLAQCGPPDLRGPRLVPTWRPLEFQRIFWDCLLPLWTFGKSKTLWTFFLVKKIATSSFLGKVEVMSFGHIRYSEAQGSQKHLFWSLQMHRWPCTASTGFRKCSGGNCNRVAEPSKPLEGLKGWLQTLSEKIGICEDLRTDPPWIQSSYMYICFTICFP